MNNENNTVTYSTKVWGQALSYVKKSTSEIIEAYKKERDRVNPIAGLIASADVFFGYAKPFLHFCAAFLLSGARITFGIRPFGIAFIAASGKYLLWAYAGALISSLFSSESIFIDAASYTLVLSLRKLLAIFLGESKKFFDHNDNIRIRMAVSLIGGSALGAYHALTGELSLLSLAAFLLYCAITPILTFLYSAELSYDEKGSNRLLSEVSYASILVSIVFSLRGISFITLNIGVISAFVLTLVITNRVGILKGAIIGLFFGLSMPAELVPMFSAAAIVSGVLFSASAYLAVTAAALTSLSWCVYAGGYTSAVTTGPSLLASAILLAFGVFANVIEKPKAEITDELPHEALLYAEAQKSRETTILLAAESEAFSSLSDMLYRLSDKIRRPSFLDVKEAAMKGRQKICRKCRRQDHCYTEEADATLDAWGKMTSVLFNNGRVTEEDLPPYLEENCNHTERVIESMNNSYAELLRSLIETDKTDIMAFDYEAISSVLRDVIAQRQNEYEINDALSKRLAKRLLDNKIDVNRVCVFGNRRKTVFLSEIKLSGLHIGENDLKKLTSEACGGEFTSPEFEIRGSDVNATLTSAESFSVRFDKAQSTKDESCACGDIAIGFPCRGNRFCALISDGMGSGKEAALTSGMCALFIEKMISAGNSVNVTLKMLNAMIRAKGTECSATIDLLDFDLLTGEARFIKSGAAPSFIVRGSEVYKIESKTIPVGIVRSLDAEQTTVRCAVGDIIVMVSDGVAETDEDAAWLYSLLSDAADRRVTETTEIIIREAERRLAKKDDATVCVIRVAPPRDDSVVI